MSFKSTFFRKSVFSTVSDELHEAQIHLLKAHSGLEWARANVTYNQARVTRLDAIFKEEAAKMEAAKQSAPRSVFRLAMGSPALDTVDKVGKRDLGPGHCSIQEAWQGPSTKQREVDYGKLTKKEEVPHAVS